NEKMNNDNTMEYIAVAFLTTEGRVKSKGIDLLLKAFALVREENSNAKLKIIGVPKSFCLIKKMISALQLEDSVTIVEPLNRTKIAREFNNADCFVLPSHYETF